MAVNQHSNVTDEFETVEDDLPLKIVLPLFLAFIGFILLFACVDVLLCFGIRREKRHRKKAEHRIVVQQSEHVAEELEMRVDAVRRESGDHLFDDGVYQEIPDAESRELVKNGLACDASRTSLEQNAADNRGMDCAEYQTVSESVKQPAILDITHDRNFHGDCDQNITSYFTRSESGVYQNISEPVNELAASLMVDNEQVSARSNGAANADGADTFYDVIPQSEELQKVMTNATANKNLNDVADPLVNGPAASLMVNNEHLSAHSKGTTNEDGGDTFYDVIPQTEELQKIIANATVNNNLNDVGDALGRDCDATYQSLQKEHVSKNSEYMELKLRQDQCEEMKMSPGDDAYQALDKDDLEKVNKRIYEGQ